MTARTAPIPEHERVTRRVRGATLPPRRPAAFPQVGQVHLAGPLDQAMADLHGWGPVTIADLDIDLAWSLSDLASRSRYDAIKTATATPSRRGQHGQHVSTFEFSIVSD